MRYIDHLKELVRVLEITEDFINENDRITTINFLVDLINALNKRIEEEQRKAMEEIEKQALKTKDYDLELDF